MGAPFRLPQGDLVYESMEEVHDAFLAGLRPPAKITVTEWANDKRYLSAKAASSPEKYRSSKTPYLEEPMDNMSPSSPVNQTTALKGIQIGMTEVALNAVGFHIDHSPCSMLYVMPTRETAVEASKQRVDTLISECPSIKAKVPPARSQGGGNTQTSKQFPGGLLRFGWANSAASLDSSPMKVLVLDEVDKYPRDVMGEGSPLDKASGRLDTFGHRKKKLVLSTPGLKIHSFIWAEFLRGDQRHWCMPCPNEREDGEPCGMGREGDPYAGKGTVYHPEYFRWTPGQPKTAHMACRNCGGRIEEARHKTRMMAAGTWIPTAENQDEHVHRSYYIPGYLSPIGWKSWAEIAAEKDRAVGNYGRMKFIRCSRDGLPWEDEGQAPDWDVVYNRRMVSYRRREIPAGVLFLTCGGDVGIDHVELHVWGWGRDNKRWLIESIRINARYNEPKTWRRVADILKRRYLHPSGAVLPIRRAGIDRRFAKAYVDKFVQTQNQDAVCAVMGVGDLDGFVRWTQRRDRRGNVMWDPGEAFEYLLIGVNLCKMELFGNLNLDRGEGEVEPPGWVGLPNDVREETVKQIVSERMVSETNKRDGREKHGFKRIDSRRAEALDCHNYARGLAFLEGWDDWGPTEFDREEAALAKGAKELARAMANLRRQRAEAGDTRPVSIHDVVKGIVLPVGADEPDIEEDGMSDAPAKKLARTVGADVPPDVIPASVAAPPDPIVINDGWEGQPEPSPAGANDGWDTASGWGSGWGAEAEPGVVTAGNAGCTYTADTIPHAPVRGAWETDDEFL